MTKLLLTIHVLAAIVAIGPVTVAAGMYPVATRKADRPTLVVLHRITRVYAVLALAIPVLGLATATSMGVLTDPWLLVSIALTVLAAGILGLQILPRQAQALTAVTDQTDATALAGRLGMVTGIFNLLWATVVILMIVRPGSSTGA